MYALSRYKIQKVYDLSDFHKDGISFHECYFDSYQDYEDFLSQIRFIAVDGLSSFSKKKKLVEVSLGIFITCKREDDIKIGFRNPVKRLPLYVQLMDCYGRVHGHASINFQTWSCDLFLRNKVYGQSDGPNFMDDYLTKIILKESA